MYDAREAEPVLPPGQEPLALQEQEMPEQRLPVVQAAEALQPD